MRNLANLPQVKIVEKIIRNDEGVLVIGFFAVLEWEGRVYAKLLRTEAIDTNHKNHFSDTRVCCLPTITANNSPKAPKSIYYTATKSHYINLDFFMSQPTRAPAFACK